jgi:pimeloyl-ACP methyl ester carboxylesterase
MLAAVVGSMGLAQSEQMLLGDRLVEVAASADDGFHHPYFLRLPAKTPGGTSYLLVEPNNTGAVSDDPAVHREAALRTASGRSIGGPVAEELRVPLLVPVFPRPAQLHQTYTHALDRDSLLVQKGPLRRLDLQLLAMVADAGKRLRARNLPLHERFLLIGFSASGTFANRFTALHPDRVQAVAAGGVNGVLLLPQAKAGDHVLPFPLGTEDLRTFTGASFQATRWKQVPQFLFLGADDNNDAVAFDDGYSRVERKTVHAVLGQRMQPDRWQKAQALYLAAGANVQFRTYAGVGHGTNGAIHRELARSRRRGSVA